VSVFGQANAMDAIALFFFFFLLLVGLRKAKEMAVRQVFDLPPISVRHLNEMIGQKKK